MILMSNELYHHGILGMKWGIRRYQNADGTLTEAGKRRYNSYQSDTQLVRAETENIRSRNDNRQVKQANRAIAKGRRNDVKNRKRLSDADLEAKVKRLQMEKQLRTLTDEEVDSGRSKTKKILGEIGTNTLKAVGTTMAVGMATYAIKSAMTKQPMSVSGAAQDIFKIKS